MTDLMRTALHATEVIARIACRLNAAGDFRGLDVLAGMSLAELDRLVQLEVEAA